MASVPGGMLTMIGGSRYYPFTMAQKRPAAPPAEPGVPCLRLSPEEARAKVAERIAQGESLVETWQSGGRPLPDDEYVRQLNTWDEYNKTLLTTIFDGTRFLDQYKRQGVSGGIINLMSDPCARVRSCISKVQDKVARLRSIDSQVDLCPRPSLPAESPAGLQNPSDRLVRICRRFPVFARQLQKRHNQRAPFAISDEYDVQDLMHALLRLEFDDVRPEEYTPSYAGKSSRMDFLLKRDKLVLEVKMTRDDLGAKEVGEQLISDIQRYKAHPDCATLVCFVYDPEHRIGNPAELENDLGSNLSSPHVHVVVAPRE